MSYIAAILILSVLGIGVCNDCTSKWMFPTYKQCEQSWSNDILGSGPDTICKVGCAMSSVAMGLTGCGHSYNPGTLTTWLIQNGGYSGELIIWSAVNKIGLNYEGKFSGNSTLSEKICANKVVILNVRNGGHWVLARGATNNEFLVNDPGYPVSSYKPSEVREAAVYSCN